MTRPSNPRKNSNNYRPIPPRPSNEICHGQKPFADSEDLCKDDEMPVPEELDTIEAMLTLSHQYRQLMQESHPSDEQIQQIDAILELAQYDENLNRMLNETELSLLKQSNPTKPPHRRLATRQP